MHSAEDITGDKDDLKRLCKHIMNKVSSKRLISKQEAMVLIAGLDLIQCTESISSLSLNNSAAIRKSDDPANDNSFLTEYKRRSEQFEHQSLHGYFCYIRNTDEARQRRKGKKLLIPNFVGVNGAATFPVTEAYARQTIIAYKPWRHYPVDLDWITEFNNFISSPGCPSSCRMHYERVMKRYYDKMTAYEPKATQGQHSHNPVAEDDNELLALVGLHESSETISDLSLIESLLRGKNHNWTKPPIVSCSIL
jgi:hypothetical protein